MKIKKRNNLLNRKITTNQKGNTISCEDQESRQLPKFKLGNKNWEGTIFAKNYHFDNLSQQILHLAKKTFLFFFIIFILYLRIITINEKMTQILKNNPRLSFNRTMSRLRKIMIYF